ncbi:MAG: WG repeat-containing protein [Bacteroidales bacterium]|nr:WG repeat-containing protein [Bacteroidales bacterium]
MNNLRLFLLIIAGISANCVVQSQYFPEELLSKYDEIGYSDGIYTQVQKDGKLGLVDSALNLVIPCIYDEVNPEYLWNYATVRIENKHGVTDKSGRTIVPVQYDNVEPFKFYEGDFLVIVKSNDLYGLYNQYGKYQLKCKYENIDINYVEDAPDIDEWVIFKLNGKYGYANKFGEKKTEAIYDEIYVNLDDQSKHIDKDLIKVKQGDLWGLIDTAGNILFPCKYQTIYQIDNSDILVLNSKRSKIKSIYVRNCYTGNLILAKRDGNIISNKEYQYIEDFNRSKTALVKNSDKLGVINQKCELIVPCIYDCIDDPSYDGYIKVFTGETLFDEVYGYKPKKGLFGYWNTKGELVIKTEYENIGPHYKNYIQVKKNGLWGLIDSIENSIIPCRYNWTDHIFHNGYCEVYMGNLNDEILLDRPSENGKFGLVDSNGTEVIAPIYDNIKPLNNRYVGVCKDKKWAIANNEGNIITQFNYDWIDDNYYDEMLLVFKGKIEFTYDEYLEYEVYNGLYGYVNLQGKEVIPCRYSEASGFYNGKASVIKDDNSFSINIKGKCIENCPK